MVAVPRKAVGMMLGERREGERGLGGGRGQLGGGSRSYLGLMEMHICRRGPRLMPKRTEQGVTGAILELVRALVSPPQDLGGSLVPTYPSGRRSRPAFPASSAPSPGCAGWLSARSSAPGHPSRSGG